MTTETLGGALWYLMVFCGTFLLMIVASNIYEAVEKARRQREEKKLARALLKRVANQQVFEALRDAK